MVYFTPRIKLRGDFFAVFPCKFMQYSLFVNILCGTIIITIYAIWGKVMKRYLLLIITMCLVLSLGVFAAPGAFGTVTDITGVLTATPESPLTADDLVMTAARLHSVYNEGALTENSSKEACYAYAIENGLIFEELFDDADTEKYHVSRAELSYILGRAIPEETFVDINGVTIMPDSDPSSLYYEYALKFINAGLLEGIDEYGSFGPVREVKRYEFSLILKRIIGVEERIEKKYIEYASDEPYYLINDYLMGDTSPTRGIYNINSGWRYDHTGSSSKAPWAIDSMEGARSGYVNTLRDLSTTDNITISREIYPQKDGELVLETSFNITFGFNGFRLYLEDIDGNDIFEMGTRNSYYLYFSNGNGGTTSKYLSSYNSDRKYYLYAHPGRTNDSINSQYLLSKQIRARLLINLDKGTVTVYISGTSYGTFKLDTDYNGLKKIKFSTTAADQIEYTVKQVHLYKNYRVNDKFITHKVGVKPYDYTTYGDVTLQEMITDAYNQGDFYSVMMHTRDGDDIYARKNFTKLGGKVKLETYLLIPDGNDGVYFSVGYDGTSVIKVITDGQKFYTVDKNGNLDKELRFFTPNVWQCIRIEADTNKQTALIKIDGKVVAEDVPFLAKTDSFNRLEIGCKEADGDFVVWFDDVEVHELFDDYEDYVPEPVPLDTGDYILSMSVCNLWRNGSHYGWSYIEPHAEIQPITGYYDEGNAEAMDWEIKFLAEHGVSTYAMCWYAPVTPAVAPVKKPRMIDAHHEGYFNAKYTEYLDFSIMWENGGHGTPGASEHFKKYIFPLWMDWYFSDPRYFRIKEDGKEYIFLTIYQWAKFRNMCLPERAGAYDSNADSMFTTTEFNQAEIDAAKLISWMEQQVIEAGYADGIMLCFTNPGSANTGNISMLNMAGSDTAIFPYAWGNTAYNIDNQKQFVESYYALAQKAQNSLVTEQAGAYKGASKGLDLLALAAVGFNDIGWAQRRYPLISDADFEELLFWFRDEYMPRYKDDEDQWKQYFIQFDTWNEYGEGHYIYPSVGLEAIPGTDYKGYGGYGYLEAMAKVFGKNYDADLHAELDIVPTQQQKTRLGRLYVPNKRMYIRREFLPTTMKEAPVPEHEVLSFKFNSLDSANQFSSLSGFKDQGNGKYYTYDSRNKALKFITAPASGTQTNPDPIIQFNEKTALNGLNTKDCSVLHIRMKSTLSGTPGQVFFRVDTMPKNGSKVMDYSEDYQFTFYFGEPNEWVDYYIDLKSHDGFTGNIVTMRLDTGNLENNTIYLQEFEFLKFSDTQKRTEITIDSHVYSPTDYWEIQDQSRNEIYIAPTDDNNFYKALHMVYDWNENTGILELDTPSGTTFKFTEGSDKVIVNGSKQVNLAKKFYVYDGAPVLPLLYILNTAKYNYTYDYNKKTLDITVSDKVIFRDIPNANAEDKSNEGAFYSLNDSKVSIIEDPDYAFNNIWKVTGGNNSNSYFVTDIEFENGVDYYLTLDINLAGLEGGTFMAGTYPLKLLMVYDDGTEVTEHIKTIGDVYYGKWNHIEYKFSIPETRVADGKVAEQIGIYIEPDDWEECSVSYVVDNLSIRRQPIVFSFKNGDAEDEDMSMWYASNTYCTRVYDEDIDSWVIECKPIPDSGSAWSYLRQGVMFEEGVTYYFSFDFKMGLNDVGSESVVSFAINSRYVDLLQQHYTSNPHDHSITWRDVSASKGWLHYSGSFTVSGGRTNAGVTKVGNTWMDEITWYVNPPTINGKYSPMSFRIDNIKFATTPLD